MNKVSSIAPFPDHIDRASFGHWLSGFTDGEGSFFLRSQILRDRSKPRTAMVAEFRIALRADDAPIIRTIQSFFGCGFLTFSDNKRSKIKNAKPVVCFSATGIKNLATIVVPHFDAYPLRAKKNGDFQVWKQAVLLMWSISKKPFVSRHDGIGGYLPKWTENETAQVIAFQKAIRDQRKFDSVQVAASTMTIPDESPLYGYLDS